MPEDLTVVMASVAPPLPRYLRLTSPMQRGDDVRRLQAMLRKIDPEGAGREITLVDGLFGPATQRAVLAFQARTSVIPPLDVDGVVGPATWAAIWAVEPGRSSDVAPLSPTEIGAAVERSRAVNGATAILAESLDRLCTMHRIFEGGVRWRLGPQGIEIEGRPLLGSGLRRDAVQNAFRLFGGDLRAGAIASGVPIELLVATACTETLGNTAKYGTREAAARAERREPGYLDDAITPNKASLGLMQTLITTARDVIPRKMTLTRDLLFQPEISIRAGAAYIASQAPKTRLDPPVVACAYNAGGIYEQANAANHWRMRQYPIGRPDHADRFVVFFNHCFALFASDPSLLGDSMVPSFFRALRGGITALTQPEAKQVAAPDPNAVTIMQFQEELRTAGLYAGPVDGRHSKPLADAIEALFQREALAGKLVAGWESWQDVRRRLAVEQVVLRDAGVEVGKLDGLLGPQTAFAREAFQHLRQTGRPLIIPSRDEVSELPLPPSGPATAWPREVDCEHVYGQHGENQTMLVLPYRMHLAWQPEIEIRRFSCHEKVHDAFLNVFTKALDEYGEERIRALRLDRFGGCLNVRKKRGGAGWSMHSWGIAIDLDPEHNKLRMTHAEAAFARPEYEPFWRIVEGEGLVSLGRTRDFDWMHFQAARL